MGVAGIHGCLGSETLGRLSVMGCNPRNFRVEPECPLPPTAGARTGWEIACRGLTHPARRTSIRACPLEVDRLAEERGTVMPDSNHSLNMQPSDSHSIAPFIGGAGAAPPTMSSREIAELTSKQHRNVLRDARDMLIQLHGERGLLNFEHSYLNAQNKPQPEYLLPKRETLILVSGYNLTMRAKIIDRWTELEEGALRTKFVRNRHIDVAREQRLTMQQNAKWAKMAGLMGNQALIAANRATVAMTGIDTLRLMGITHMNAPTNEALMSPTDIGKRFSLGSGRAVNILLCQLGLQSAFRDSKGHLQYEPTETGKRAGGIMQDTGKSHGSGVPVRQLRWPSSVGARLLNDNVSFARAS